MQSIDAFSSGWIWPGNTKRHSDAEKEERETVAKRKMGGAFSAEHKISWGIFSCLFRKSTMNGSHILMWRLRFVCLVPFTQGRFPWVINPCVFILLTDGGEISSVYSDGLEKTFSIPAAHPPLPGIRI